MTMIQDTKLKPSNNDEDCPKTTKQYILSNMLMIKPRKPMSSSGFIAMSLTDPRGSSEPGLLTTAWGHLWWKATSHNSRQPSTNHNDQQPLTISNHLFIWLYESLYSCYWLWGFWLYESITNSQQLRGELPSRQLCPSGCLGCNAAHIDAGQQKLSGCKQWTSVTQLGVVEDTFGSS